MKCEAAVEHVHDYADGRIDSPLRVVLDRHYAECAGCQRELTAAKELAVLFRAVPQVEPPVGFRAQILARAAELAPPRPAPWYDPLGTLAARFRVPLIGVTAAAAAALLFTQTSFQHASTLGVKVPLPEIVTTPASETTSATSQVMIAGVAPSAPQQGASLTLNVVIRPKAELANGRVIVPQMSPGLALESAAVPSDRGQIVWQGSVHAGRSVRVPLRLRATGPDVQRVLLYVEGDRQSFQRQIRIPVLSPALKRNPPARIEGPWSASGALEQIARQFDVLIATDLSHERQQPTALQLTVPGQAIGQVAAERGMRWTDAQGVFNVYSEDSGGSAAH